MTPAELSDIATDMKEASSLWIRNKQPWYANCSAFLIDRLGRQTIARQLTATGHLRAPDRVS